MAGSKCDVCEKPSIGVASSSFGPVSFAFCEECSRNGAEPEWIFVYLRDEIGPDNLHESAKSNLTFTDGRYMSFDEWLTLDRPRLSEPPDDATVYPEEFSDDGSSEFSTCEGPSDF